MQTFKRIVFSAVAFIVVLGLVSALLIEPVIQLGLYYYCDGNYRDATVGQYTMLFVGDSDGLTAFCPSDFDAQTGLCSYNLSGEKITFDSEYYLLKNEIERNPVKEVILQIGISSFSRDYTEENEEGNGVTALRINNFFERLGFLSDSASFDGLLDVYSKMLTLSILSWIRNLTGDKQSNFDKSLKGWHPMESNDITIDEATAKETYDTEEIDPRIVTARVEQFCELIQLCRDHGADVTVIMVPMADAYIWKKSNCDEISDALRDICSMNDVPYYDFNLLKNRYEVWNDHTSFKDSIHLSEQGAHSFTKILADIYHGGSDTEDALLFYDDYGSMKAGSPYAQFLDD